jgi:hypothetical protein
VYIGARAFYVLHLVWFGNIARLSQRGERGKFPCSNDFYLPSLPVEEVGVGVGTLCIHQISCAKFVNLAKFFDEDSEKMSFLF